MFDLSIFILFLVVLEYGKTLPSDDLSFGTQSIEVCLYREFNRNLQDSFKLFSLLLTLFTSHCVIVILQSFTRYCFCFALWMYFDLTQISHFFNPSNFLLALGFRWKLLVLVYMSSLLIFNYFSIISSFVNSIRFGKLTKQRKMNIASYTSQK